VAAAPVVVAPAASAQACSDVMVVFARSTGEPPGIGRVARLSSTRYARSLVRERCPPTA
jgi:hypothetical protein